MTVSPVSSRTSLKTVSVGVASVTHSVIPVFVAWIPLLAVPWWLTRPVAGEVSTTGAGPAGSAEPPLEGGERPDASDAEVPVGDGARGRGAGGVGDATSGAPSQPPSR